MLIYHPAFDAYHCVFRMLALIEALPEADVDLLRICDFYLVFPSALKLIKLPANLSHGKRIGKESSNVYRDPISPKLVFRDMAEIQLSALRSIAASGLIGREDFERGIAKRSVSVDIPVQLADKISKFSDGLSAIFQFLVNDLSALPLRGIDGLKHRTDLLEYRYDAPEANT